MGFHICRVLMDCACSFIVHALVSLNERVFDTQSHKQAINQGHIFRKAVPRSTDENKHPTVIALTLSNFRMTSAELQSVYRVIHDQLFDLIS